MKINILVLCLMLLMLPAVAVAQQPLVGDAGATIASQNGIPGTTLSATPTTWMGNTIVLVATVNERFKGLTLRSLDRLMEKLDAPQVSDNVVLKAVELGAKAMGVGGNAAPQPPAADHLAQLANRLIDLQANIRKGVTFDGQATVVQDQAAA